ncbi:DUF4296 domain-containing protein [Tenacibaculum sp. 190524A05c]|uniref:DUF4296 domain-containing protein n=1 Tax=Tenacibaculum platacis TaxID=3137852 RepID=UPI0032B1C4A1
MKKLKYIIPILVLFVSCTGNTIYKAPDNLIPRDTMVMLLTDMHIAASARGTKNKFNKKGVIYMHFVHEKYNIDSTRFDNSNKYYTSIIDNYEKLLNDVKQNLQDQGVVIQKEILAKDSINKIEKTDKKDVKLEIDSLIKKVHEKRLKKPNETQEEEE